MKKFLKACIQTLYFIFTDCGDSANRSQAQGVKTIRCYDPNLSYMDRVVMEIVETERLYATDLGEIISVSKVEIRHLY